LTNSGKKYRVSDCQTWAASVPSVHCLPRADAFVW